MISEYITKEEVKQHIEQFMCRWCKNYKSGLFCADCALCKISQAFLAISLTTPHYFNAKDEIHLNDDAVIAAIKESKEALNNQQPIDFGDVRLE